MKGRRYVWSDPRLREIARSFIPAADECGYLQAKPARGPEAELFQKIAEQGHYAGRTEPTASRQGTYAAAPSGKLLASINSNDPERVLEMLRAALENWKAMDRKERLMAPPPAPSPEGRTRLESQYPEGGLVLQQFSRDLPRKEGRKDPAWNLDFAWFTKEEARSMLPPSREPGARQPVSGKLVRRLAMRHLLDNVRGQTSPFSPEHVKKADLALVLRKVEGDILHLSIEGATRAVEKGTWELRGWNDPPRETERGFEAALAGSARWDLKKEEFLSFDLVAHGPRWGGTRYNDRADDLAPQPLGIAFRKAPTTTGPDRVAPAHAWGYFR